MGSYYCLMAGLPDLKMEGSKLDVTLADLKEQLQEILSEKDKGLVFYFFLKYDCQNLVKLLKNPEAETSELGNFSREQYIDLITSANEMNFNVHRFPTFMSEFARSFSYNKDKKDYFAEDDMSLQYYNYALQCPNKFIKEWFQMNLDVTNILTAMIARQNGWNVGDYIQGDNEVCEMIREHNTKDFDLTHEYDYVKDIIQIVECDDPVLKEKKIDAFKWIWLEEKTFMDVFSIEAVFAFLCKTEMIERWEKLDPEQGKNAFTSIIENLRREVQIPEEFKKK